MDLVDSIFLDNHFLLALPLSVKALLMAFIIVVWIVTYNKLPKKSGILFQSLATFFAILFIILLLNSSSQIVDFLNSCTMFFADIRTSLGFDAPTRYFFNIKTLIALLVFVAFCTLILFFITRTILGREVKLSNTFWEHKDTAQSKILWCNALFFIMLFLIFLTAFSCFGLIFTALDNPSQFNVAVPSPFDLPPRKMVLVADNSSENFLISLILAFILVTVIFCTFIFQKFSLAKHSIDKLAKTLNATEITESSNLEQKEQMLLNVITEMAIASSCPMPRVFILKEEKGINAMCSGEYFGKEKEKIAIFVTQGALNTLSRDELQGVIGHEFSHAFHRDVALNLRIFALVFALSRLVVVGEVLLRAVSDSSKRTSRSKDDGKGFALLVGIALVFFALGYIGMFFAQIIQAAISRQKEFLADASSTQYTRNPQGIKSALQTIAQVSSTYEAGEDSPKKPTYLINPKASSCAHMFFLPCRAMIFATHPPLEQRILRLEQMGAK
ncbi:MAG: M48 family metalloprotease [Helicobacter sp.]|uniref:M48 family metalloprotease n=1 Tax=Helicobacter sp. TaxID=218 RepID=UPI0023C4D6AB|nr:M48 family metalloprotease [Helicobacter sp.]MDE5925171.1 M48 family metalloprotease [Helicobacter sp.]MDE7176104.1 M48 family metalloprotease [Helicobacter sp.]